MKVQSEKWIRFAIPVDSSSTTQAEMYNRPLKKFQSLSSLTNIEGTLQNVARINSSHVIALTKKSFTYEDEQMNLYQFITIDVKEDFQVPELFFKNINF